MLLAHGHLHRPAGRVAHLLVEAANLPHNVVKGLLDVPPRLGRRLDELAAEGPGQRFALWLKLARYCQG